MSHFRKPAALLAAAPLALTGTLAADATTGTLTGVSLHGSGFGSTEDFDGPAGAGSGTGPDS